jgi:hypothetical protein
MDVRSLVVVTARFPAFPVIEKLVAVDATPGADIMHGAGIGGQDLEDRARRKASHAILRPYHRKRAEQPERI